MMNADLLRQIQNSINDEHFSDSDRAFDANGKFDLDLIDLPGNHARFSTWGVWVLCETSQHFAELEYEEYQIEIANQVGCGLEVNEDLDSYQDYSALCKHIASIGKIAEAA